MPGLPHRAPTTPAPAGDTPRRARQRARFYLDNAASTPLDPAVADRMDAAQRDSGANPSSVHRAGLRAAREVEAARLQVAGRLGCPPERLFFTGSATEANNLALKGAVWAASGPSRHLIVSAVEHPSVLGVADWLEATGQAAVTRLPVDAAGRVSPDDLDAALRDDTVLVSVMHANNEVGTIQPLADLAASCRARGVPFHTDACQGFCKAPLDAVGWGLDLVTVNAHKLHGPKGVGAIYVRDGVALTPLVHGGGHEQGMRSGTLNVAGIAGFGEAVARFSDAGIAPLRARLLTGLRALAPDLRINGDEVHGVLNILNFALPGRPGKPTFVALDRAGVQISASSACHATKLTPSHVLLAMGQSPDEADEALRVSLGRFTTAEDIDALLAALGPVLSEGGAR